MNIVCFDSAEALAQSAAEVIAQSTRVALCGGTTPLHAYRLLRTMDVDWPVKTVFWSDDRFVPPSDPASNEGTARRELLDHVPVGEILGMVQEGCSPEESAEFYEARLRSGPQLDLVLLGMGSDGHTLSLFPGAPELEERERWVVPSIAPVGVRQRITFTIPAVLSARRAILLVAGEDKAVAWRSVRESSALPAGRLLREIPHLEAWVVASLMRDEAVG